MKKKRRREGGGLDIQKETLTSFSLLVGLGGGCIDLV